MFPSHNKAQAEFNWILILIAGIVILVSFIAFAMDYKSLANRRINTELSLALSSQLDSFTTARLTTLIDPNGMDFFSTRISCNSIIINDGYPVPVDDNIIFASDDIITDKLLLWVDEFSLPYKIANVYFISSPYIKYYIMYDDSTSELANAINGMLPLTQDNKQLFNILLVTDLSKIEDDIKQERLREIRIVTFNDIDIPSFDVKTKVIRISNNLELGDVYYPDTNEDNKYVKKQLLLGSIFSDNYDCSLKKLISRLNTVNKINEDKATRLFTKIQATKQQCNYQLFINAISQVDTEDIESLPVRESRLIAQNQELNKKGCPDVF